MRSVAAAAAVLVVLAGCAGDDDERAIEQRELSNLVLHPRDLGAGWIEFGFGRQARTDAPPGARADPARFGRMDGWIVRYHRRGGPETRGPLVVESRVDLFGDADGAGRDFQALEGQVGDTAPTGVPREPELGDEAVVSAVRQGTAGGVAHYTVAWRHANVTATVSISGFSRRTSPQHALSLARKQERRIARALED